MRIDELGVYLRHVGLNKPIVNGVMKFYAKEDEVLQDGEWVGKKDVFGIYKAKDGRFCFFITDGTSKEPTYSAMLVDEAEACDELIHKISRLDYKSRKEQAASIANT